MWLKTKSQLALWHYWEISGQSKVWNELKDHLESWVRSLNVHQGLTCYVGEWGRDKMEVVGKSQSTWPHKQKTRQTCGWRSGGACQKLQIKKIKCWNQKKSIQELSDKVQNAGLSSAVIVIIAMAITPPHPAHPTSRKCPTAIPLSSLISNLVSLLMCCLRCRGHYEPHTITKCERLG